MSPVLVQHPALFGQVFADQVDAVLSSSVEVREYDSPAAASGPDVFNMPIFIDRLVRMLHAAMMTALFNSMQRKMWVSSILLGYDRIPTTHRNLQALFEDREETLYATDDERLELVARESKGSSNRALASDRTQYTAGHIPRSILL